MIKARCLRHKWPEYSFTHAIFLFVKKHFRREKKIDKGKEEAISTCWFFLQQKTKLDNGHNWGKKSGLQIGAKRLISKHCKKAAHRQEASIRPCGKDRKETPWPYLQRWRHLKPVLWHRNSRILSRICGHFFAHEIEYLAKSREGKRSTFRISSFDIYLPVLSSPSSINAFFASIGLTEVLKLRRSIQVFFENRMASALATRSNEWTAKDLNLSFSVSRFGQTSLNLHMRNN